MIGIVQQSNILLLCLKYISSKIFFWKKKEKIYPGSWKGTRVRLHLDIEEGLKLYTGDDKVNIFRIQYIPPAQQRMSFLPFFAFFIQNWYPLPLCTLVYPSVFLHIHPNVIFYYPFLSRITLLSLHILLYLSLSVSSYHNLP